MRRPPRTQLPLAAAIAVAVVTAVGGCAGSPGSSPGATGAAGFGSAAPVGSLPADGAAIQLTFAEETEAAAEGGITLEAGGKVVATATDGSTFELVVPPGAVAADTTIRLTPLRDVKGFEGVGHVHGVLLEPDGLEFFQLVRLTITPSTPIAIENEYMFEAEDDGTDVRPAIVDPAAPGVVMLLEHFTVGGVASMTPDQQAASKAKSAENADRRISDAVRERLADDRERQKQGGEKQLVDVTDLLEEYKREVLDKLKEAAALSCDFLYQYIKKLISFERQVQLLGVDTDRSYAAMVDEVFRILEQRYPQCEQEAIKKCRDAKDPQILIAFWLKNREVGYQTNVPVPEAMKAKAQQLCKPDGFQFHFAGTGTGDYGYDAPIKFEYWGLLCPEDEVWQIWEMVDHELGTESTGTPAEAMHGPILATFDDSGLMSSATYGPFGALPPGYLVHRTSLSLAPPGAPTSVTAKISAGQIDVVVTEPVVPWDGSFGKCEKV